MYSEWQMIGWSKNCVCGSHYPEDWQENKKLDSKAIYKKIEKLWK